MRWPQLLFVGWLTIFPQTAGADDPGDPHRHARPPAHHPETIPRPSLLHQNSAARFSLVLGRLQLDPVRYRKGSQTLLRSAATSASSAAQDTSGLPLDEPTITESLQVNSVRGNPTIHYSLIDRASRISIDADTRGTWRIETQTTGPSRASTRVTVQQQPGEPLLLQHFTDQPVRTIRAATWLHLREADRLLFAEFLEPVLDELLAPYDFAELADAAQRQSVDSAGESAISDATLAAWIEDLGSPSRATRMTADRNLRGVGISLLPRLAGVDASRLDAEQRHRLAKIRASLTPLAEDNAATLATLIRDDAHYWQLASNRLGASDLFLVQSRLRNLETLTSNPAVDSPRIAAEPAAMRR
ncbi:MAG: hypothetical protein ACO1RT_11930 [Planctomycetaceae bacterium]